MEDAIDGFVIRTLFQPVADRLAPRISTFNIARFFCDGMLVFIMVMVAHGLWHRCSEMLLRLLSCGIGILIYRLALWLAEIEWTYRSLHQGRRFFLAMRLLALCGLGVCAVRLDLSGVMGVSLLVCSAYFSSCALRQPA